MPTVYREGNAGPCVLDAEPNDSMLNAPVIVRNDSATGSLDTAAGDYEDWYQFTANTGDQITVTVKWGPTAGSNWLFADLTDAGGQVLQSAGDSGSPKTITIIAPVSGTYYVHLMPAGGLIGYNVSVNVGDANGACSVQVLPGF